MTGSISTNFAQPRYDEIIKTLEPELQSLSEKEGHTQRVVLRGRIHDIREKITSWIESDHFTNDTMKRVAQKALSDLDRLPGRPLQDVGKGLREIDKQLDLLLQPKAPLSFPGEKELETCLKGEIGFYDFLDKSGVAERVVRATADSRKYPSGVMYNLQQAFAAGDEERAKEFRQDDFFILYALSQCAQKDAEGSSVGAAVQSLRDNPPNIKREK